MATKRRKPSIGRLQAFELEGLPPAFARLRVEAGPRFTALVGRNGAGKSAILEGLHLCAQLAIGVRPPELLTRRLPIQFKCEFELDDEHFAYEFSFSEATVPDDEAGGAFKDAIAWTERCANRSGGVLWQVNDGIATADNQTLSVQPGTGLLGIAQQKGWPHEATVTWLKRYFGALRRVPAGVPRSGSRRQLAFVSRPKKEGSFWPVLEDRIRAIEATLLNWAQVDDDTFVEFVEIGRRMKVWDQVLHGKIDLPGNEGTGTISEVGYVSFDGVNIGLLSDGTLRVAEIIRLLLSPSKLILIEEPETSVHPALLSRLMAEISAYVVHRQIILSTHSTQVVSCVKANELRLVHRGGDGTLDVKGLSKSHLAQLKTYLEEDGTLGDFIFEGGAKSEEEDNA